MENASKALLISASILIAILLIAMGVRVFNSTLRTKESVDESMLTTEQTMLGNKFSRYCGENKTKADVISLINEIIAYNSTNKSGQYVDFNYRTEVYRTTEKELQSNKGKEVIWEKNKENVTKFHNVIEEINNEDEKHNFTGFKIGINYGKNGDEFIVCAWPTGQKNQ